VQSPPLIQAGELQLPAVVQVGPAQSRPLVVLLHGGAVQEGGGGLVMVFDPGFVLQPEAQGQLQ
jgi:hypothetical protein